MKTALQISSTVPNVVLDTIVSEENASHAKLYVNLALQKTLAINADLAFIQRMEDVSGVQMNVMIVTLQQSVQNVEWDIILKMASVKRILITALSSYKENVFHAQEDIS